MRLATPRWRSSRASLVEKKLSDKRINNILAVLSKALRYAEEAELVEKPPRVRLYRLEKPEIEAWGFEEYGRILDAARVHEPTWYVAALLARRCRAPHRRDPGARLGSRRRPGWPDDHRQRADAMGHKRIEETMLYVQFAGAHTRPIPNEVLAAGATESDPNRRVLAMLGTRGTQVAPAEGERPNY